MRVLLFTIGMSLLTGIIFGILPALSSRVDLTIGAARNGRAQSG